MSDVRLAAVGAQLELQMRWEHPHVAIEVRPQDGRLHVYVEPGHVIPVPKNFGGLPVERRPLELTP